MSEEMLSSIRQKIKQLIAYALWHSTGREEPGMVLSRGKGIIILQKS